MRTFPSVMKIADRPPESSTATAAAARRPSAAPASPRDAALPGFCDSSVISRLTSSTFWLWMRTFACRSRNSSPSSSTCSIASASIAFRRTRCGLAAFPAAFRAGLPGAGRFAPARFAVAPFFVPAMPSPSSCSAAALELVHPVRRHPRRTHDVRAGRDLRALAKVHAQADHASVADRDPRAEVGLGPDQAVLPDGTGARTSRPASKTCGTMTAPPPITLLSPMLTRYGSFTSSVLT